MIYQPTLKGEVSDASGIPFTTLADMPYAEWAAIRDRYLGWSAPTHCAACGVPLTPQNKLRQHAGGVSCSHGPHD